MEIITKQDYEKLIKKLKQMSCGKDFIEFSKKIIRTNKEIIGLKTPVLRKLAKEISKQKHDGLFIYKNNKYYEEILLRAMVISFEKDFEKAKLMLLELYRDIDNWAIVDTIVGSLAFVKNTEEEQSFNYFKSLLCGEEFEIRFGIVAFLKYFIYNEKWIEKTFDAIKTINCEKYYVEMAIAWLIAEVLVKYPQNAIKNMQKIIKNNHFNKFIVNKSIQKACESYRIDKELKDKLKELRVKC